MPKPNCTEGADVGVIDFGRLGRRVIEGHLDGGSMTSDGGVMLLSAVDRKLGLIEAASRCIADPRNPLLIKHAVRDMLRQRVYGLALGWEDLNDHGALRLDVAMQTAVGVDREVASAPTLCRLESWADRATAVRLEQLLVEQFIASFKTAPEELVLDFDATDNPLHGQQEQKSLAARSKVSCGLFRGRRMKLSVNTEIKALKNIPPGRRTQVRAQLAAGQAGTLAALGVVPSAKVGQIVPEGDPPSALTLTRNRGVIAMHFDIEPSRSAA